MAIDWTKAGISALALVVTAVVGGLFTVIDDWYIQRTTILTPPDLVFPIVWTTVFALVAISLYNAWTYWDNSTVLYLYPANLVLNILWSFLFFKLHMPMVALFENALLWTSIYLIIKNVWSYSKTAAELMLPYLMWVTFAILLNILFVLKDMSIPSLNLQFPTIYH